MSIIVISFNGKHLSATSLTLIDIPCFLLIATNRQSVNKNIRLVSIYLTWGWFQQNWKSPEERDDHVGMELESNDDDDNDNNKDIITMTIIFIKIAWYHSNHYTTGGISHLSTFYIFP